MLIISHRINTIGQLKKTPKNYGVEVDVRAFGKKLVLNHEPHQPGDDLAKYLRHFAHKFIIFNIKEAGVEREVISLAKKHRIADYFLLDVEFPFIVKATTKFGISKIAVRFSEYEPLDYVLSLAGKVDWVWVDVFSKLPLTKKTYRLMKKAGFKLCLVSPEQLNRPQDIKKYQAYCKKNKILFDAVMCEADKIKQWES